MAASHNQFDLIFNKTYPYILESRGTILFMLIIRKMRSIVRAFAANVHHIYAKGTKKPTQNQRAVKKQCFRIQVLLYVLCTYNEPSVFGRAFSRDMKKKRIFIFLFENPFLLLQATRNDAFLPSLFPPPTIYIILK